MTPTLTAPAPTWTFANLRRRIRDVPEMLRQAIEITCLFILSFVSRDSDGNRHTDVHWPSHFNAHCDGYDEGYHEGYEDGVASGREMERDLWHKTMSA